MKISLIFKIFFFYMKASGSLFLPFKIYLYFLVQRLERVSPIFKTFRRHILPNGKFRPYYMKTPFGIFLCRSPRALAVLRPNYELYNQRIIRRNIDEFKNEKHKIFINIGTHIGRHFIPVAKKGYLSYGFEPTPPTFKAISINTILSNVDKNTHLYNFALGNKEKIMDFKYYINHDGGSKIVQDSSYPDSGVVPELIKVPVKIFDKLDLGIDFKKVRLIVMDVECFEYHVLKGMKKSLSKMTDVDVLIEINEKNPDKNKTIELMKELGFKPKKISVHDWYFRKRSK